MKRVSAVGGLASLYTLLTYITYIIRVWAYSAQLRVCEGKINTLAPVNR